MTRNYSRSRIVRNQEWDPALAELHTLDLAQLVLGLLGLDAVNGEATLGVVDETEELAGLLDGDDVHEARGVGRVGADLAVDLDEALHQDGLGLTVVEGVLEAVGDRCQHICLSILLPLKELAQLDLPVTDEDDQRQAVPLLVRTGRGLGRIGPGHFVQEPVRGGAQALLVLLSVHRRGASVSRSIAENIV